MEFERDAKLVTADPGTGAGTFVQSVVLGREVQHDALVALQSATALIDIKPGSWPNSINVRNKGVIPVAVLSSDIFDAATVDPTTAAFGPAGAPAVHDAIHVEDVDFDGYPDLVMHFATQETGIACGDESADLFVDTYAGTTIVGTDAVRTVGCN